jgi:nucleoside-diphosphate-sugar epimerase
MVQAIGRETTSERSLIGEKLRDKRILVTGASGLVGFHCAAALLRHGAFVVAAVRQSSNQEALQDEVRKSPERLRVALIELTDERSLLAAMAGCDGVVHTAATIDANGTGKDLRAINVSGTKNALMAAKKSGVKHFVHISSLAVITGEDDKYNVTEEEPLNYCREPYANSKIDAENIVMYEAGRGVQVTSLRPGFIYGPNEHAWMPRLIDALKKGRALVIGDGSKETNVIYVENLCYAISLAMFNPVAYGQVYNLTDGQRISKRQLFDSIADGLSLPRANIKISVLAARLICETSSRLSPLAPSSLQPFLARYSRPAFRLAALNQGFDIGKAERELGYTDRIPFEQGMAKTLAHWRI